jgi:hypothetical protein
MNREEHIDVFCGVCRKKEGEQAKKCIVHSTLCIPLCRMCAANEIAKAKKANEAANTNENTT